MPSPPPDKRRLILDATRRLLVQKGSHDLVLDDVARAAGVAKGTLFLYFKSKDELFYSVLADLADQLGDFLDGVLATGKRGRDLIEATIRGVLAYFDQHRDIISPFNAGRFPSCGKRSMDRLMEKSGENRRRLTRIFQSCAKDGLFQDKDFSYECSVFFGLCRSAMIEKTFRKSKRPLEQEAGQVLEFFLHGIQGGG